MVETNGGRLPRGIGWDCEFERLDMMLGEQTRDRGLFAVVPVGADDRDAAIDLTWSLRRAGFAVDLGYRGNVSRRLKRANKIGAAAALLLGEDERARGVVTLRDLETGEQAEVPLEELKDRLARDR